MFIKGIEVKENYIEVTTLKVTNDLELDFVCIQEDVETYKSSPFFRIRDAHGAVKALEWLISKEPLYVTHEVDHVYSSPIDVDMSYTYMKNAELLQCIEQL